MAHMKYDPTDFHGLKFQYNDHVVPSHLEGISSATVWGIVSVSRDHAGPGKHYYAMEAPGYGTKMGYEENLVKVDLPISVFPVGIHREHLVEVLKSIADIPLESFDLMRNADDERQIMGWNDHKLLVGHVRRARNFVAFLNAGSKVV